MIRRLVQLRPPIIYFMSMFIKEIAIGLKCVTFATILLVFSVNIVSCDTENESNASKSESKNYCLTVNGKTLQKNRLIFQTAHKI